MSNLHLLFKSTSVVIHAHEVKSSGSYREIGLKIGRMLQRDIDLFPKFSKEKVEKGKEFEKEVRKQAPDLAAELQGTAEGSGVDYDTLATYELSLL